MRWEIPAEPTEAEAKFVARFKRGSKFFAFLWEIRGRLFSPEFQDELIAGFDRQRGDNVPPAMLAMTWLLQAYTQASDRDAVENAVYDARWQLVLGIRGTEEAPFGQGSLPRFRARLVRHDLDRRLVDRTVELARETGLFGDRNLRGVLDSSPLRGAGRVEDTWNLIGRAMRNLVEAVANANGEEPTTLIAELCLSTMGDASLKATLDIDWADEGARVAAFQRLVDEANRLSEWVRERRDLAQTRTKVESAMEDLSAVLRQDTEPDPDRPGTRIRQGVATDRMPSLGDKEMRHGRKSQSFKFTGYKRFFIVMGERLIAGALAQPANLPECDATATLVDDLKRHGEVVGLDFDRGFLASPTIPKLREEGVEIRCKPWRHRNGSYFPKEAFILDLARDQATCPAKQTVPLKTSNGGARKACWGATCVDCTLRSACTTAKQGRTVQVHPFEEFHQELRMAQATPEGRAALRERVTVEHALARLQLLQGSQARYKGTRKNTMDIRRYASLNNLIEIGRFLKQAA